MAEVADDDPGSLGMVEGAELPPSKTSTRCKNAAMCSGNLNAMRACVQHSRDDCQQEKKLFAA
ncbi:hypothetical protein HPB48_011276 [Haemaphysalis longicornis]|uniref:Uncharacterized protein n=1 Tax=Haemaphysalis longicornis TaxID=44386 RepID=A0A9J6G4E0_HAELO|nr:hypothetical protein HPB48_011276 [Haemaphysalis longicornis]